jgi:hypothetical protein
MEFIRRLNINQAAEQNRSAAFRFLQNPNSFQ